MSDNTQAPSIRIHPAIVLGLFLAMVIFVFSMALNVDGALVPEDKEFAERRVIALVEIAKERHELHALAGIRGGRPLESDIRQLGKEYGYSEDEVQRVLRRLNITSR